MDLIKLRSCALESHDVETGFAAHVDTLVALFEVVAHVSEFFINPYASLVDQLSVVQVTCVAAPVAKIPASILGSYTPVVSEVSPDKSVPERTVPVISTDSLVNNCFMSILFKYSTYNVQLNPNLANPIRKAPITTAKANHKKYLRIFPKSVCISMKNKG